MREYMRLRIDVVEWGNVDVVRCSDGGNDAGNETEVVDPYDWIDKLGVQFV